MCLMLLLLGDGPRLSHSLIACLCMLRKFHWLRKNPVYPVFCFRQEASKFVFGVPFDGNEYFFSWINFDNSLPFVVKSKTHRKERFLKAATLFNVCNIYRSIL